MNIEFQKHKNTLFTALLGSNHHDLFMNIIYELHKQGHNKKEIYELFLEFHKAIQVDEITRHNDNIYNNLSDFMDGFTAWGGGNIILPNEANC